LVNNPIDVKLESPCHRVLLPFGDVLAHHSFEARPAGNAERSGAAHILLNTRLPAAAQRAAGTQFRHIVSNIAVTITGNRAIEPLPQKTLTN
jgi:hypothetical protein